MEKPRFRIGSDGSNVRALVPAMPQSIVKAPPPANLQSPMSSYGGGGWWPIVREPFTGAWQRNLEQRVENVLSYAPVFRCVSLIASDVAKNRMMLVAQNEDGIWKETESAAFSPVLRIPNHFQNNIQFYSNWMVSKLLHGNTYVLKERDARGLVVSLYILDPTRTKPLVAESGDVYYQVSRDLLSGIDDSIAIPASEIMHDRSDAMFHPLVGLSPLFACSLPASQGLSIQRTSSAFFTNGARPSGILTAPGTITDAQAERLKQGWDEKFTGNNSGRVAVLGDGLNYVPLVMKYADAQMIEQKKEASLDVCTAFGVPAYKIGVGPAPAYNNIEALTIEYYSSALQIHVESIEKLLDTGLALDSKKAAGQLFGAEFDLDNLLRMDTATLVEAEAKAVGAGVKAPNEARRRLGLGKVRGGDTPYLQQQNYSLAALDKRDSQSDPFASKTPPASAPADTADESAGDNTDNTDSAAGLDAAAIAQLAAWQLKSALGMRA